MSNYEKKGLPEDLLTSKTEGSRSIKVSSVSTSESIAFASLVNERLEQFTKESKVSNDEILMELRLLNAVLKEALESSIEKEDL